MLEALITDRIYIYYIKFFKIEKQNSRKTIFSSNSHDWIFSEMEKRFHLGGSFYKLRQPIYYALQEEKALLLHKQSVAFKDFNLISGKKKNKLW